MIRYEFECHVPVDQREVFEFHARPANLAVLQTDWPGFRILDCEDRIRAGATMWIEQTVLWIVPVAMGFRFREVTPPDHFTEELFHGPFSRFVHTHIFEPYPRGTIIRDHIEIEVPPKLGGTVVERLYIGPMLKRIFRMRHRAMYLWAALDHGAGADEPSRSGGDAPSPPDTAAAEKAGHACPHASHVAGPPLK